MPAEKERWSQSQEEKRLRRPAPRRTGTLVRACRHMLADCKDTAHDRAYKRPKPPPPCPVSDRFGKKRPHAPAEGRTSGYGTKIRSPRRDRTTSIRRAAHPLHDNEIRNRRDSGYTIRMPLMRHDMLEELFERDAVIVTQISQRRKGDAVPTALDSPDIQISIKTHVFLRQATLPANGFQSLYNLLHQQVIAPLSFHIANYCNNEIKFYYILVSGGGISDISDAILHCLFPINTKISHLYPHGEPQIHGKTGSTSAQFVP